MRHLVISSAPLLPAVALLAALAPSSMSAGEVKPKPSIEIWVDGKQIESPRILESTTETGKIIYTVEKYEIKNADFSISLDAIMNPDPAIGYALGVADFGAPSAFAFLFITPIVATGSPNSVSASIVGGLTDFTGNGVSITPTFGAVQIGSVSPPLTGMGVDVGPAQVNGPGLAGALYPYGSFASGPIAGPAPGPWTSLQAAVNFSLSGGGDLAALTGFAQIIDNSRTVPEAGTMGGVVMLGALAGGWCWRRKRAAKA